MAGIKDTGVRFVHWVIKIFLDNRILHLKFEAKRPENL